MASRDSSINEKMKSVIGLMTAGKQYGILLRWLIITSRYYKQILFSHRYYILLFKIQYFSLSTTTAWIFEWRLERRRYREGSVLQQTSNCRNCFCLQEYRKDTVTTCTQTLRLSHNQQTWAFLLSNLYKIIRLTSKLSGIPTRVSTLNDLVGSITWNMNGVL